MACFVVHIPYVALEHRIKYVQPDSGIPHAVCESGMSSDGTIPIHLLCYLSLQITWEERWHSILSEMDVDVARRYVVQNTPTHACKSDVLTCLNSMCSAFDNLKSL